MRRLGRNAPAATCAVLHRGGMVRVHQAVVDEAREAQREGRPFDVDEARWAATAALVWLDSAVYDYRAMRRLEARPTWPAWLE